MSNRPRVLFVGGPDVDARIELMQELEEDFCLCAAGTVSSLQGTFQEASLNYHTYPMARRVNPISDVKTLASLVRLFRGHRPEVVHAFDTKPCVLARLAAKIVGVPIVVGTLPGLGSLYVDDRFVTRAARKVYENLQRITSHLSDLTIFQNGYDADQFVASGIVPLRKISVIPGSGVNTDRFDPAKISEPARKQARAELGLRSDVLIVTMVSRLIRSKGVMEFAEAARILRPGHPDVRFLLVGSADNEGPDTLTAAERSQITSVVTWVGPRSDIPTILATSDLFVLPSYYREGIPRVLIEAASMALPIITTDSPGCNEAVKEGVNGFLVSPHDAHAVAQAILQLVQDPETRHRFGQESRSRAVAQFDLSTIAGQIRSSYRELLTKKGIAPTFGSS